MQAGRAVMAVGLCLAAAVAHGQAYQLTNIVLEVPFGTVNSDTSPSLNVLGGFATLSNGTVTVSGAAWEWLTTSAVYTYSGDWSVEIGDGVNLSKLAESCTGTDAASACDSPRGLVGDWILGQLQDGTPCQYGDSQCFVNASVTGTTQGGGDELIIVRQTEFVVCPGGPPAACFNDGIFNNSKLTLTYTRDVEEPPDNPPIANPDEAETVEGVAAAIEVLANDQALDDPVTVTIATMPSNGTVVVSGSPGAAADILVLYTPNAGFTGIDVFDYQVTDSFGSDTASVTVTVLPLGANDDTAVTVATRAVDIDVLGNDNGFLDPVRLEIILAPDAGGTAEIVDSSGDPVPDGIGPRDELRVRYVPASGADAGAGFVERFSYQVTGPVEMPPAPGVPGAAYELTNIVLEVPFGTVNSDTSPNLNVLGGFATLSNGTVTVSGAAWESLTSNAVYTYSGDWSVEIGDGVNLSKLAESCTGIDAASACDSPRGLLGDWIPGQLQDGYPCQYGDTQCFVNASVTGTTQFGIDELIIVRQTEFVVCPGGPPAACFNDGVFNNSKLTLTYTLFDSAFFPPPPPGANDDLAILTGSPVTIDVLANDRGFASPLLLSVFEVPLWGTAAVTGSPGNPEDIRIVYTPGANFPGLDTFRYVIDDGVKVDFATVTVVAQQQDTAEVTVTVLPRAINDVVVSTAADVPVLIDLLGNDIGLFDPVSVAVVSGPAAGVVELLESPGPQSGIRLRYTPNSGFRGIDSLVYSVTDEVGTETATVGIAVGLAADDFAEVAEGQSVEIDVLANDGLLPGTVSVQISSAPGNGSAMVTGSPGAPGDIRVIYTPNPGFPAGGLRASDSFEYLLSDGLVSATATVEVSVFVDADGDGVPDDIDNCLGVFNPDQRDTNGSGFGNRCDADLNGDGIVNFQDLAIFRLRFGSNDPDADFNGDGIVNFADLAIFQSLFGKPPGPSALVP